MSRRRQIPDDDTLRRIFAEHPDATANELIRLFGWDVSWGAVLAHRRRLRSVNPIVAASTMPRDEFRLRMAESARLHHWSLTGVDNGV